MISIASEKIGRVFGVKDDDFKRLQETLSSIKDVLSDAEKKLQVEKSGAIKDKLMKLKEVVYDIEDIVDEFDEYEALRRKLVIQGHFLKKVRNFFSPSNPLAFRFKMSRKIKNIYGTLDEITRDHKERFQFASTISGFKRSQGRETYSHLDDFTKVVGRELEKSKVIDLILNNNSRNHSIVRIVGLGGVGKTTLAQLIYNDKQVKDHFDITMWVWVSDNSTDKVIFSNLLESINKKRCDRTSLDVMVSSLKQALGSKRYLMVLDDVWNDGISIDWEKMLTCLLSMGAQGSRIIMTSRSNENIPCMMDYIYTHRLEGLHELECWSIFEKIAFGNGGAKKTPKLIKIGKEIVKKCGGVPLAAKTLGGMMYSISDEGVWLSVQQSDIWSLLEELMLRKETPCLAQNRCNTQDNLKKKGWQLPNRCYLCEREEESAMHLFINCNIAKEVRRSIYAEIGFQWNPTNTIMELFTSKAKPRNLTRIGLILWDNIAPAICWSIWKTRNEIIFNDKKKDKRVMIMEIKAQVFGWAAGHKELKDVKCREFLMNWKSVICGDL